MTKMFSKKRISITNITSIGFGSSSSGAGEKRSLASTVASTARRLSLTSSIATVEMNMAESLSISRVQGPREPSSLDLIERSAWDELREFLVDLSERIAEMRDTNSGTADDISAYLLQALPLCVLHAACRGHAPLDVLRSIHGLRPSVVTDVDSHDRTALHHAAAAWNEPPVVKFLLRRNGDAASHADADGRTPLHLCVHPEDATDGGRLLSSALSQMNTKEPPLVRIIHYLCCVSPASATVDDDEDCTPIEYAIDAELPLLAVQVLRKASETAWKRQEDSKRRATMSVLASSRRQMLAAGNASAAGQTLLAEGNKADECPAPTVAGPMPPQVREGQTIRRTSAKSA